MARLFLFPFQQPKKLQIPLALSHQLRYHLPTAIMSDATNNQPLLNNPSAMKEFLLLMDYTYALLCLACGAKVLDPDKKKNQTYLNGKCPSCGQMSKPHKPILENIIEGLTGKSKKQQKKEAKRQRREEKKQEKRRIAELRKHNRRDNDRVVAL